MVQSAKQSIGTQNSDSKYGAVRYKIIESSKTYETGDMNDNNDEIDTERA